MLPRRVASVLAFGRSLRHMSEAMKRLALLWTFVDSLAGAMSRFPPVVPAGVDEDMLLGGEVGP